MIRLKRPNLALLTIIAFGVMAQQLQGYMCTFKNNTHATIMVEFDRFGRSKSGPITILPMSSGQWDAGKCAIIFPCSIAGMEILSMTFGQKTVPGAAGFKEDWSGLKARAVSPSWIMSESFPPDADGKARRVQFSLFREPAGVGGSTYPGGVIWQSEPMSIK